MFSQVPSNIQKVLKMYGFVRVDGLTNDSGKIIKAIDRYHNTHGRMGDVGMCLVIENEIWITGRSRKKSKVARRSIIDDWARHLRLNFRRPNDFPNELRGEIKTSDLLHRFVDPDYEPDYTV